MTRFFQAFAAAMLLAGCAASSAEGPSLPLTTTLQPQASVAIGAFTLLYQGADDSRCPLDAQCVWAGEIRYNFKLSGAAGSESFALTRAKPAHDATTVPGVRISLAPGDDPPLRRAGDPQPAYPVTVTVSRP